MRYPRAMSQFIEETNALLVNRPRSLTYQRICAETGLTYHWLSKFASGAIPDPGARRLEVLRDYLLKARAEQ
jgi:hypothetical protein